MKNTVYKSNVLVANNIYKDFGKTSALRGVNLEIKRGEVLAIMGPSGSGKSTFLHCLAGVLLPDKGEIIYYPQENSQDKKTLINGLKESERSKLRLTDFGFIFQFGQLLPELSALDNVTIPLLLAGMKRSKALNLAKQNLADLDLSGMENKFPTELSGGQAQRVAIARSLVTKPKILFADEPTGSLDSLSAENVLNLTLNLVRKQGATVVLITHDARTASYADREIVVRDGAVSNMENTVQHNASISIPRFSSAYKFAGEK